MTKKLTWEVEKTSLVLKVTDGAKETTWKLRKNMRLSDVSQAVEDIWLALQDTKTVADLADQLMPHMDYEIAPTRPMIESVRTVDAEELEELRRYNRYETSEEASRAAQAREVQRLNINAKWFETDDDETYGIPIPDYDSGEVRPR